MFRNKIVQNASWIIIGKIVQSALAFIVNILTARYLGPSNYGIINYASSIVVFVIPIAYLGFNNTLVQEMTKNPDDEGQILGTSILLSLLSSVACIIGVITFAYISNPGDSITIWVVAIYSMILIFQVLDLIQYWFQAKLLSKYSSIVALIAYTVVSAYKIVLLINKKSVYWFAAANVIDYMLIAIMLLYIYKKLGGKKLSVNFNKGKIMLNRSKHYIVTGLMVAIFSQTDKIMLKQMIDESATGYYSAAISIASVSSFIYVAIIDSFRPVIFQNQENTVQFELNLKRLYSIVIYLSLFQSLLMTILSRFIVGILYGKDFSASVSALQIVVWYTTFSYLGSIRNIWMLAKEKQKYLWIINLSGAMLNVVINLLLIPVLGINGAALASLMTQFFTNYVMGFVIKPIRENNRILMESLNPKYISGLIKRG